MNATARELSYSKENAPVDLVEESLVYFSNKGFKLSVEGNCIRLSKELSILGVQLAYEFEPKRRVFLDEGEEIKDKIRPQDLEPSDQKATIKNLNNNQMNFLILKNLKEQLEREDIDSEDPLGVAKDHDFPFIVSIVVKGLEQGRITIETTELSEGEREPDPNHFKNAPESLTFVLIVNEGEVKREFRLNS